MFLLARKMNETLSVLFFTEANELFVRAKTIRKEQLDAGHGPWGTDRDSIEVVFFL
jgi:hypothetical protein